MSEDGQLAKLADLLEGSEFLVRESRKVPDTQIGDGVTRSPTYWRIVPSAPQRRAVEGGAGPSRCGFDDIQPDKGGDPGAGTVLNDDRPSASLELPDKKTHSSEESHRYPANDDADDTCILTALPRLARSSYGITVKPQDRCAEVHMPIERVMAVVNDHDLVVESFLHWAEQALSGADSTLLKDKAGNTLSPGAIGKKFHTHAKDSNLKTDAQTFTGWTHHPSAHSLLRKQGRSGHCNHIRELVLSSAGEADGLRFITHVLQSSKDLSGPLPDPGGRLMNAHRKTPRLGEPVFQSYGPAATTTMSWGPSSVKCEVFPRYSRHRRCGPCRSVTATFDNPTTLQQLQTYMQSQAEWRLIDMHGLAQASDRGPSSASSIQITQ